MKTKRRRGIRRQVAVTGALAAALMGLAASCGGASQDTHLVGSESHFLTRCNDRCGGGLECIAGICTTSCLTSADTCSELSSAATCTNQSVEPGLVAVCDVRCEQAAECGALGAGYACDGGFCRGAQTSLEPEPGDCRPVGNHRADETTPYVPCCPGLNEISTRAADTASSEPICRESGVRDYACIEGSCGDGVCEGPEAPCGCGVDCPSTYGRWPADECEPFLDASPPPTIHGVTIVNTGSVTLHVQLYSPACPAAEGFEPALVHVDTLGPDDSTTPVNIYGPGCARSCQSVVDSGWNESGEGGALPTCPELACPPASPLPWYPLAPGESLYEATRLEWTPRRLPLGCADGIVTAEVNCLSQAVPQPGAYVIYVVASPTDCTTPDCTPSIFRLPVGDYYNQDHTLEIALPAP